MAPRPAGASFAASLRDSDATSTHGEQYYEMIGNRGFYREGWSAVTLRQPRVPFSDERWELHHLAEDPTETIDLAEAHPEKLAELTDGFETAAWANQVFPLDEGNFVKALSRPPSDDDYKEPVTFRPFAPTPERWRCLQLINFCNFDVSVDLDFVTGDEGILVAHGDQGGGYCLFIEKDRLFYSHNGYGSMTDIDCGLIASGTTGIRLKFAAPGDRVWNLRVLVGDAEIASYDGLPVLTAMAPFEGIDVGIDRRSPVNWSVYERRGPFRYTGILHGVTYTPGELAPDAGAQWLEVLREAGTKFE